MKREEFYLQHIAFCINRIEEYTQHGHEAFLSSPLIQDAVIRNFEIIGEAVKRLSSEFCNTHSEIPWHRIARFRDVLIHQYFAVDLDQVWTAVVRDLLDLRKVVLGALGQKAEP